MPLVVPVKFTYASRDLWFDPQDLDILEADYAICSTERGTEIGLVTADPFEVPQDEIGQPLKPVLRVASDIDLQLADDLAIQGDEAMVDFRRLVKELDLEMKPVGVEYLFGGEKAVFYFAAEERVDFRQLVKDLSSTLHIRVDMRQIGVRDETRLVGGYAQCGQELCCTRFGGQFEPVSIRMAKEQDLPLNSSKISGVCGRLMCCLRYEFEAYKDFKSRAPKKKTLIDTPLGKARIQEYDTPREQLVLRLISNESFVDNKKLVTGKLNESDWEKVAAAADALNRTKILIDDDSTVSVADINAKCRRVEDLGLVVIDYLQLMTSAGGKERSGDNRQQIVSDISRALKIMAKELNVPVLCLSQLSRANESRTNKRPMLSDLRESGAIEQDADIVMFLYREDYYEKESENHNLAECIIAKNRHGETRTVELQWLPEYTTFSSIDRTHEEY